MLTYIALAIAFFFAMNIGASGTAAAMGAAYGADAIKNKRIALLLVAISAFLGAVLGGGEVVKTISQGIIPSDILQVEIVVIILFSATFTLFISNLLGIPLSTSEVTVGAIVGVGIAYQCSVCRFTSCYYFILVPSTNCFISYNLYLRKSNHVFRKKMATTKRKREMDKMAIPIINTWRLSRSLFCWNE